MKSNHLASHPSKGDTQEALKIHAEGGSLSELQNTDVNKSIVRFVYKNFTEINRLLL